MRSRTLRQSARTFVEVAQDSFIPHDHLALDPNHIAGAADLLRSRLRELLGGLAPLMGEDTLLAMCRDVIAEDRLR